MFVIFLSSRIIMDLFGFYDITNFDFYVNEKYSYFLINRAVFNVCIAFVSYYIGYIVFYCVKKDTHLMLKSAKINISDSSCYFLITLGLIVKLYYAIDVFFEIISKGYLALYTGDLQLAQKNIFINIIMGLYDVGMFVMLFSRPGLSKKIIYISFVNMILSFANGQRGPGALLFIFVCFIYYHRNKSKIKINPIKIGYTIVLFIFILSFVGWLRSDRDNNYEFSILNFIWSRGASLLVLVESIRWESIIDYDFLDLFGQIYYFVDYYCLKLLGESFPVSFLDLPIYYKFYSGYISYISNSTMYDMGFGIGGSYVAELFSVGKECAQFVGGICVGLLVNIFYFYFLNSRGFAKFYSFHILPFLLYIPRDNMLDFILQDWWVCISYLLVLFYVKSKK